MFDQTLSSLLHRSACQLYCELRTPPETFPDVLVYVSALRRCAGDVCTSASKCIPIVRSDISEAARRSTHGMQFEQLSGEWPCLSLGYIASEILISCR